MELGTAVGFGLTDESGVVRDTEPGDRPQEVAGPVLRSPVMTQLDPSSHIRAEPPEAVDHRVVDRLQRSDTVADLGYMGPRFGRPVVDVGEHPHPPIEASPGHGGVGAPPQVGAGGNDRPVMWPRFAPSPGSLGSQQTVESHQPQHPLAPHPDPVFPTQPSPHLAVTLT